jgi:hypothetical protein
MTLRVLETVYALAALGIRFYDPATGTAVSEGLRVSAQMLNTGRTQRVGKVRAGIRSGAGVYVLNGIYPTAERQERFDAVPARRAVVDVEDTRGRFLPVSFEVSVPLFGAFRGVGAWLTRPLLLPVPPAGDEEGVYLWSQPSRPIPASLNAVYAQVVIGSGDNPPPAPYALVHILTTTNQFYAAGFTDARGSLMIPVPYPALTEPDLGDPLPSLMAQQFALRVRVFYQSDPDLRPALPGSRVPDLAALLGQPQVQIARRRNADDTLVTANALNFNLLFEQPTVLRTLRGPDGEPFLRIQP